MSLPFTPIDDSYSVEGTIVSVELFAALAANVGYLLDAVPVGQVIPVMVGLTGVPTPNPLLWQLCDGSLITNPNSPIRNQHTPDQKTAARLIFCPTAPGTAGHLDGFVTKNLSHSHGGATTGIDGGYTSPAIENDNALRTPLDHTHTISLDLSNAQDMQPAHYRVQFYLKIL